MISDGIIGRVGLWMGGWVVMPYLDSVVVADLRSLPLPRSHSHEGNRLDLPNQHSHSGDDNIDERKGAVCVVMKRGKVLI